VSLCVCVCVCVCVLFCWECRGAFWLCALFFFFNFIFVFGFYFLICEVFCRFQFLALWFYRCLFCGSIFVYCFNCCASVFFVNFLGHQIFVCFCVYVLLDVFSSSNFMSISVDTNMCVFVLTQICVCLLCVIVCIYIEIIHPLTLFAFLFYQIHQRSTLYSTLWWIWLWLCVLSWPKKKYWKIFIFAGLLNWRYFFLLSLNPRVPLLFVCVGVGVVGVGFDISFWIINCDNYYYYLPLQYCYHYYYFFFFTTIIFVLGLLLFYYYYYYFYIYLIIIVIYSCFCCDICHMFILEICVPIVIYMCLRIGSNICSWEVWTNQSKVRNRKIMRIYAKKCEKLWNSKKTRANNKTKNLVLSEYYDIPKAL